MAEDHTTQLLDAELLTSIDQLEGAAPLLARMARFHLGWVDPAGAETDDATRKKVRGKRMRPQVAFLSCAAVHGNPTAAAPVAAAIELLHNFTLVHDDIQDRSPNRRHRATVWRIWGDGQAINAGDALFAVAQRTLLRTSQAGTAPGVVLRLVDEFNRATIEIVRGQVLDLEFENVETVPSSQYLGMINGKTAAIVRYAAWAGAIAGGASDEIASLLARVGESLGMGFQIRDDVLGIWGTRADTGKDEADDIRRRKKSLPILLLLEHASRAETTRLMKFYGQDEIDPAGIAEVMAMLEHHRIQDLATEQVRNYHHSAEIALQDALPDLDQQAAAAISGLIQRMDSRTS